MTIASIKSIFIGVGGSIILALFCSTFLTHERIFSAMPLFIAFNGALTGFRLMELLREQVSNVFLFSSITGAGAGAITFVVINFALSFMENITLLGGYDLFIYMVISGITSYLGAKLAVRYFNL